MQAGVYRVEIEHANSIRPHKSLGFEVDPMSRERNRLNSSSKR